MKRATFFLHGLESSSQGNKGRWFQKQFPQMIIRDYQGSLNERMKILDKLCRAYEQLVLVGSSFGGLMAVNYAMLHPEKCEKLILLAPALNFDGFVLPKEKLKIPTLLIIGEDDTVTPADVVLPLAEKCFTNLKITLCNDDHMLASVFRTLGWHRMIGS